MTYEWIDVALRQAGAISAAQILAAGASPKRLLRQGAVTRIAQGVYLLAPAERTWKCSLWVGLLSSGPAAFACRRSAAALWGFDGVEAGHVEVGVPAEHRPRSVAVVRYAGLRAQDVLSVDGLPSTGPARTLIDLGAVAPDAVVERGLEYSLRRRLTSLGEVEAAAKLRVPGGAALRRVLRRRPAGATPTESDAETLFVLLARSMGLPDPLRQYEIISRGRHYRLDFAWLGRRLAVEIDGAAVHGPGRLTADVRRQNGIVLNGWTVLRFTWAMLVYEEGLVRRDLAAAWQSSLVPRTGVI